MKKLNRAAALTAALLILLSIVIKPIKVSAAAAVTGAAIGAGWVLDLVFTGYVGGKALEGATAVKDALDNGTIDNRVEQWLWDKASQFKYGYTQAQVDGKVYKAELTYRDLKDLAALLSEAYPEGQITTDRGHIVTSSNISDFPVPLPIDTEIYFTDITQTGETAISQCLYLYTDGVDIRFKLTKYQLPSGSVTSSEDNGLVLGGNGDLNTFTISLESNGSVHTHIITTFPSGYTQANDFYLNLFSLSNPTLITYSLPTYVPGVGLSGASSADIADLIDALQDVPFGMSDDDVAVSIPVTGDDVGEDSKPDIRPGVIPSGDELIDDVPEAAVEGDFSNFKLPNGLMYVFPFSLPYDFYRGITLFSASPEVPEFTYHFQIPYPKGMGSGYLVDKDVVINFGRFEKLAIISRWVTTFAFTMLLIKLSAFILKGGNS